MWLAAYECRKLYAPVAQFYGSMKGGAAGNHQTYEATSLLLRKLQLAEETARCWYELDHNHAGDYIKLLWPEAGFLVLLLQGQPLSRLLYKVREEQEVARYKAEALRDQPEDIDKADYEAIQAIYQLAAQAIQHKPALAAVMPWLALAGKRAGLMVDYLAHIEKYELGYEFRETVFTVRDIEFTRNSIEVAGRLLDLKKVKFKQGYYSFQERVEAGHNALKRLETTARYKAGRLPAQENMLSIDAETGGILAVAVMALEKFRPAGTPELEMLAVLRSEIAEKTPGYPGYRREGTNYLALDRDTRTLLNAGLDLIFDRQSQLPEWEKYAMLQNLTAVRQRLNELELC